MISAKRVILTSFTVDLFDVGSGLLVTILSGSIVMLAETMQGLTDLVASGLLIIGLSRSTKVSDKKHPFGHGRELYFWTLISSLIMLGITSTLSFYFGWQRFLNPEPVSHIYLAYLILGITMMTNGYAFWLSLKRLTGKESKWRIWNIFFKSPLVETKATFVLDLMGASASFLGLLALIGYKILGDQRLDGLGAMMIGVVLAVFAFLLIMSVKDLLVGISVSDETKIKIIQAATRIKEVNKVINMRAAHIGPEQMLINLDVNLRDGLETDQIEDLTEAIKKQIRKEIPEASMIQIELNE